MKYSKKSTVIWVIALLIVVALLAISASLMLKKWPISSETESGVWRVDQVWANAQQFDGQIIRVRGKIEYSVWQTLILCCPDTCDCNETGVYLYLLSESRQVYNQDCSSIDRIGIPIDCSGNECSLTCSPFDPYEAEALELVGRLQLDYRDGKPCWLTLSELDLAKSLQLAQGNWMPIPVGTLTRPLITSTPPENACKDFQAIVTMTPIPDTGDFTP